MNGLLDTARRAWRWMRHPFSYYPVNPVRSTITVPCAANCGRPVALGDQHWTMVRNMEWIAAGGEIHPLDGDNLAYLHLKCWPASTDTVTLTVSVDHPDDATVSS